MPKPLPVNGPLKINTWRKTCQASWCRSTSEQRTTADDIAQRNTATHRLRLTTKRSMPIRSEATRRITALAKPLAVTSRQVRTGFGFYSVTPREDRAYFEQGVETYYSLHVHAVNDRDPQAHDYQELAKLIGVRLETTPVLSQKDVSINAELNPGSFQHGHEF